MQSLSFGSEAFPLFKRHPLQESPPHGFRPLKEGLCRLLAEPTPSPRPCISAWARPSRTRSDYHDVESRPAKSGTSHFAQNRNFSLCADTIDVVLDSVSPVL